MSHLLCLLKRRCFGIPSRRSRTWKGGGLFRPILQQLENRVVPSVTAIDDIAYAVSGKPIQLNVVLNDVAQGTSIDPTTVTITTNVGHGTTSVSPTTGVVTYTPDAAFIGGDTFQYTVKGADGSVSNVATVTITTRASVLLPRFDTTTFAPNDDETYPGGGLAVPQPLGFTINFFGLSFDQAYINNNGNITFDQALVDFTPFDLTSTARQIIAPFFGDVDTRASGNPTKFGQGTVDGHPAFGVTWDGVDYYFSDPSHTNYNSFQLVLIDRSDIAPGDFDFEFNYDYIQWEAGEASGGNSNGLGGFSARAGYSNGTGNPGTSLELAGSAVNGGLLDSNLVTGLIHNSRNSGVLGRYIFTVRNGLVDQPTFTNLSAPNITFGTISTDISGHLDSNTLGQPVPAGETIHVTLNGVTQDALLDNNDDFTTTFSTAGLGVAGSPYTIGFHYDGDSTYNSASGTSTLTVIPATPLINWTQPADITYGTALSSTQLDASAVDPTTMASLGGAFVYTPPAGTILDAGLGQTLQVTFTPTDSVDYTTASDSVTINVEKATPTFSDLSAPTIVEGTPSTVISGHLIANAGTQLVPAGEVIEITINGVTQDALLDSNDDFTTTFDTSALLAANSPYTIGFSYAGDEDFNSATDTSLLTIFRKATPTFSNLSAPIITFGTPSTAISGHLNANNGGQLVPAGEPIHITLNGVTQDALLDGNDNFTTTFSTGALGVAGSPYTIGFVFAGDSHYETAGDSSTLTVIPATPLINWPPPADITYGTALTSTQLNATALDANTLALLSGQFTYTPAAATVLNAGFGQALHVTFTPADSVDYTTATGSTTINVGQATPAFTRLSAPTITQGTTSTVISGHLRGNAGARLVPAGEVIEITLKGMTRPALLDGSDNFSISFVTGALVVDAPYTIGFTYAGDGNFAASSGTSSLTVRPFEFVTGADAGGGPHVELWDAATGKVKLTFMAYSPFFNGGVRVTLGNIRQTRVPDIITAPGPGMGSLVEVFDGVTGQKIFQFMAFDARFIGGAFVATADFNGDGYDDIAVGADAGGGPHVKIFDGKSIALGSLQLLASFYAYSPFFNGGVRLAAADVNGDGTPDLIAAPGPGGSPDVRVFNGMHLDQASDHTDIIREFLAYSPYWPGGVYVAAGDVSGDGKPDIITGAGAGGSPHVKVFSGRDLSLLDSFMAYSPSFNGGVRVGYMDGQNGRGLILTAAGGGTGPLVRVLDGPSLASMDSFYAYSPFFIGGVFIGGE